MSVIVGAGYGAWGRESAASVAVRDGDVVVATEGPGEAIERASQLAGFTVAAPRALPAGFVLKELFVSPPPPAAQAGVITATDRIVSATFVATGTHFRIDFLRDGFNPVVSGEELKGLVEGSQVFWLATDEAEFYSMLSHGRGVILIIPKGSELDREDARKMLSEVERGLAEGEK